MELLGDIKGVAVWNALASVPFFYTAYLLARRFLPQKHALGALAFMLLDPAGAHIAMAGALPHQAFAITYLVAWGVTAPELRRRHLLAVLSVALIPWLNMPAAALSGPILLVFWAWRPRLATALTAGAATVVSVAFTHTLYANASPFGEQYWIDWGTHSNRFAEPVFWWPPLLGVVGYLLIALRPGAQRLSLAVGGLALLAVLVSVPYWNNEPLSNISLRIGLGVMPLAIIMLAQSPLMRRWSKSWWPALLVITVIFTTHLPIGDFHGGWAVEIATAPAPGERVAALSARHHALALAALRQEPVLDASFVYGIPRLFRSDAELTLCLLGFTGVAAPEECGDDFPRWWFVLVPLKPEVNGTWWEVQYWPDTLGYTAPAEIPPWWEEISAGRWYALYRIRD